MCHGDIKIDVQQAIPNTTVFIHLEPNDDPASWNDVALDHTEALP